VPYNVRHTHIVIKIYDVRYTSYAAKGLKLELDELNRKLLFERIVKDEMRKKMSKDRDELMSELRSND
jgi:hypothetical protein